MNRNRFLCVFSFFVVYFVSFLLLSFHRVLFVSLLVFTICVSHLLITVHVYLVLCFFVVIVYFILRNICVYFYLCLCMQKCATLKLNSMTADPPLSETKQRPKNKSLQHTRTNTENEHCRKCKFTILKFELFLTINAQYTALSSLQRSNESE